MNKKHVCISLLLLLSLFLVSNDVSYAKDTTVTGQTDDSSIRIQITAPIIGVEVIKSPNFGTQTVSKNEQVVTSEEDLVIQVTDPNEVGRWQLNYSLTYFKTAGDVILNKQAGITIQRGKLYQYTTSNGLAYVQDQEKPLEEKGTLISLREPKGKTYRFIAKKEDIDLIIPANPKTGDYVAIQTVVLASTPNY